MNTGIVVLGAPNEVDGTLSVIAKSRCDKTFEEYLKCPNSYVICTGGFGNFNLSVYPHGSLTQQYLMDLGIPQEMFLKHVPSRFTFEDATLAKPVLAGANIEKLVLVSSEFHLKRVEYVFRHVFPDLVIECVAAKTPLSDKEIAKLKAHEVFAMKREKENILKLKSRSL